MTTTVIRPARTADLGAIDRLLGALAHSLGTPRAYAGDLEALRKHGFGKQRLFRTLLAVGDGIEVGLCVYFPEFSTWRCRPGAYVQDLFVADGWRGNRIGCRLLGAAARHAGDAWGARYLRLAVHTGNRGGSAFYRASGFTVDSDSRAMMLTGDAFVALARRKENDTRLRESP